MSNLVLFSIALNDTTALKQLELDLNLLFLFIYFTKEVV